MSRRALSVLLAAPRVEVAADRAAWFDDLGPRPDPARAPALPPGQLDRVRLDALIDQRRAELDLQRRNAVPDVTVNGAVSRFREASETAATTAFVLGLSVPLPVFDRNQGNILRAGAEVNRAEADAERGRLYLDAALADSERRLDQAWRAADSLRRTVLPAAQEAAGFAREGYAAGKFSLLEVLDAQRALSDVREQLNAALLEVQQVRADIARLRGRVGRSRLPPRRRREAVTMKPLLAFLAGAVLALGAAVLGAGGAGRPALRARPRPADPGRRPARAAAPAGEGHGHEPGEATATRPPRAAIRMTEEQVAAAGIEVAEAGPGTVARRVSLPGTVAANADRLAHVPARVAGIVTALNKRLGDTVAAGEVLAVVESARDRRREGRLPRRAAHHRTRPRHLRARAAAVAAQGLRRAGLPEGADRLAGGADPPRPRPPEAGRHRPRPSGDRGACRASPSRRCGARRSGRRSPGGSPPGPRCSATRCRAEAEVYTLADLSTVWVEMAVPRRPRLRARKAWRCASGARARRAARAASSSSARCWTRRRARPAPWSRCRTRMAPSGRAASSPPRSPPRSGAWTCWCPRGAVQEIGGETVVFVRTPERVREARGGAGPRRRARRSRWSSASTPASGRGRQHLRAQGRTRQVRSRALRTRERPP